MMLHIHSDQMCPDILHSSVATETRSELSAATPETPNNARHSLSSHLLLKRNYISQFHHDLICWLLCWCLLAACCLSLLHVVQMTPKSPSLLLCFFFHFRMSFTSSCRPSDNPGTFPVTQTVTSRSLPNRIRVSDPLCSGFLHFFCILLKLWIWLLYLFLRYHHRRKRLFTALFSCWSFVKVSQANPQLTNLLI